jgi:hypothetical protein
VWRISSGIDSLSAHVIVEADRNGDAQLEQLHQALQERFDVGHITLQLEPEGFAACRDSDADPCSAASVPAAQCRAAGGRPVDVPFSGG